MNNNPKTNPRLPVAAPADAIDKVDAIDRILAADEGILPSSGFLSAVMERVHEEAAATPPLPFPWKRAIPGIALAAGVFGWGAVEFARILPGVMPRVSATAVRLPNLNAHDLTQAGWIALAGVVSLLSWGFALRLTRRSGGY